MNFKIFIINLDESIERMNRIQGELERLKLHFERISAVNGKNLDESQILKHYSPKLNRKKYFVPLSKAEIGCYMSHLKVCEKIVSENLDYAIVFEDDISIKEGFSLIPNVLDSIKEKWDYIKLISPGREKKIIQRKTVFANVPAKISYEKWSKDKNAFENSQEPRAIEIPLAFELVKWEKPPVGTSAYAISRDGAKEFLSKRSKFFRPIDVDLQYYWETNLNVLGLLPQCVKLIKDKSTIQNQKPKYHYPLARLIYKIKFFTLFRSKNKHE